MRRTRFTSFSESLGASLAPLLAPLNAPDRLVEDLDATAVSPLVGALRSVRQELEAALADASQRRPHVLVAGPPKAGKSTLLVALARAYVTRVTDLPGLPTPVRVVHAPTWSLALERFDGTRATFREPTGARVEVHRAQRAWVEGLRAAEVDGADFEPSRHAPRAAARIELQVPARALAEARTALVELPHLAPELAATGATLTRAYEEEVGVELLVVRTEDLSRTELLRAYEPVIAAGRRAYLVLNLDPRKADLGPDGARLTTGDLEDPVGVVEAFQTFAASRAWLDAFDEGRLRVHLLPLHDLAAARLAEVAGGARAPRAPITPRRAQVRGTDALSTLEDEIDATLHDGARWQEHVRQTLDEVGTLLGELRTAFHAVAPAATEEGPASLVPGLRGLERAVDALQHVRRRHLG